MKLLVMNLLEIRSKFPHPRALILRNRRMGTQILLKKEEPLPARAEEEEWMLLGVID